MTVPTTPLLAVQSALYARLSGDQVLADLAPGGVLDYVPEDRPYPFVHLGEATEAPDNSHSTWGRQTTHTLHVWSRYRGFAQALAIAGRVVELLDHQPLTISGWHHLSTRYEFSQTLTDPDPSGMIRHVPVRFRITTERDI
ncbi:DUF3168 domain-containing protein [Streptomyces sp. URMC 129]|uniref:DUF3168 domain-containing protein n=1 Tax=Streptomyces sp. URMC 129 TaxID=3423407 RepID=UPI003F1951AD